MSLPPRSEGDPQLPLLLWEVQQVARVSARLLDHAMQAAGITAADYGVLACINDEPGLTQAQIARQLQVRPQTLTRTVERLRLVEYVHGAPAGRGRRSHLDLTDAGRAALNAAWPHVLALNSPETLGMQPAIAERIATQMAELCGRLTAREQSLATPR